MAGHRAYALTICGFKKPGMSEEDYHNYISENHSGKVAELLVQKKILGYNIQHNDSKSRDLMGQIFGSVPEGKTAPYDAFVQIIFKDVQDYIAVKDDPVYKSVIFPDHANFADFEKTTMVTGWIERKVLNGEVV